MTENDDAQEQDEPGNSNDDAEEEGEGAEARATYIVLQPLLLHHEPQYNCGFEPHPATEFVEGAFITCVLPASPAPNHVRWVEVDLSKERLQMLLPFDADPRSFFLPVLPLLQDGSTAQIDGVSSRPELNGQTATCLRHDEAKGRWHVRLASGAGMSLRDECLRATAADGSIQHCLRPAQPSNPKPNPNPTLPDEVAA